MANVSPSGPRAEDLECDRNDVADRHAVALVAVSQGNLGLSRAARGRGGNHIVWRRLQRSGAPRVERIGEAVRVLMITCEWPGPDNPHGVPFIVRQVEF